MSHLLILAGGMSSRMKAEASNLTLDENLLNQANNAPKGMIGVGRNGRPLIDYQIYIASQAGYKEVMILINELDSVTKPYYEPKSGTEAVWGLTIKFATQFIPKGRVKPFGTADAVMQALEQHPEWQGVRFTVCNSDNLYSKEALQLLASSRSPAALISYEAKALGVDMDKVKTFAVLFYENGFLQDIIEKPTDEEVEHCLQVMGRLGISMNIFSFDYDFALKYMISQPINPLRNEKELPMAVRRMANDSSSNVQVFELQEFMPDLTSKSDIIFVQKYLLETYKEI